jgi:hypothetical protein
MLDKGNEGAKRGVVEGDGGWDRDAEMCADGVAEFHRAQRIQPSLWTEGRGYVGHLLDCDLGGLDRPSDLSAFQTACF